MKELFKYKFFKNNSELSINYNRLRLVFSNNICNTHRVIINQLWIKKFILRIRIFFFLIKKIIIHL